MTKVTGVSTIFVGQKICQTSLHKLCKYNMYSIGHWERERKRERERRSLGVYIISLTPPDDLDLRERRERKPIMNGPSPPFRAAILRLILL